MTSHLFALGFDAHDPELIGRFWAGVLRRELDADRTLPPGDDTQFRIRFLSSEEPKKGPNQVHFDLTSTTLADQRETVARALGLGARRIDIGQGPDATHEVLADPEGNEFCVLGPGNRFLAGTGFLGALAGDGTQAVGYFWSAALGWPLVWDQDQETAIQSPRGGAKITWGGPPVAPKLGKNRMHFDLAPPPGGDQSAEVERLIALGARRLDIGQGADAAHVVLADPDGNEFCVLPARELT